ncbi:MAG TPA: hypothetical protein VHE30_23570, partial [Polyangiaceae bacterium]|nr:hypothetical protein [Polyangiaceae bacterium]
MTRRREVFTALVVVLELFFALDAAAGEKDAKATKVLDRIMNELFSSAKFEDAKASLEKVIAKCSDCSPRTRALLHADLGIVLVTGFSDTKNGKAEFAQARKLDPTLTLDPAFASPEAQSAFAAAGHGAPQSSSGAAPADVVLEDEEPGDEEPVAKKKKAKPVVEAEEPEDECARNSDCSAGELCASGRCVPRPPPPKEPSVWLSLGLSQEFSMVSGDNVCTKNAQVNLGYTCLRSSGSQYHGTPLRGAGGSVSGFGLGPTRLLLGTEFRVADAWSVGLRVGYAFAGDAPKPDGGKAFFPLSAEFLARYWLSQKALSTNELGWFVLGSGGVAQGVGKSSATVKEDLNAPKSPNQIDNPAVQTLDVYRSAGLGFVSAGPGLFLPLGRSTALVADLRLLVFLPTSGFALGLSAGIAFGL